MRRIYIILILFLFGCATVPRHTVWRPWSRSYESGIFDVGAVRVSIQGITEPLKGDESLFQDKLRDIFSNLIERRGFDVIYSKANYDYDIVIEYKTKRYENIHTSTMASNSNYSFGYGNASNYGVVIAQIISANHNNLATNTGTVASYNHVITIVVKNNRNKVVWTGESMWESSSVDIMNHFTSALKELLSDFPKTDNLYPEIQKLHPEKAVNFYEVNMRNKWFSSTMLPYRIVFNEAPNSSVSRGVQKKDVNGLPQAIRNKEYIAAYLDLLLNAEVVLPTGGANSLDDIFAPTGRYDNPIDTKLWRTVRIGGVYDVKDKEGTNKQVKILINLTGNISGYRVSKCWVATDDEYSDYLKSINEWTLSLEDFFDFYE